MKDLSNLYSHLTNTSINKFSQNAQSIKGGFKWTFDTLKHHLRGGNVSFEHLWVKIEMIIILTLINLCPVIPDLDCCYELFGFDVMIDAAGKPWLIEVNSSPAMSVDCPIDQRVKSGLVRDTLNLAKFENFHEYNERIRHNKLQAENAKKNEMGKFFNSRRKHQLKVTAPKESEDEFNVETSTPGSPFNLSSAVNEEFRSP